MTTLSLTHSCTPPKLEELNEKINQILGEETLDSKALLNLINQRDQLVLSILGELDDSPDLKAQFAQAEAQSNTYLLDSIKGYRQVSQEELKILIKGRKAVQKYA